jgi:hypothetical protein
MNVISNKKLITILREFHRAIIQFSLELKSSGHYTLVIQQINFHTMLPEINWLYWIFSMSKS